jgi:alpha-L-rhamnosidase
MDVPRAMSNELEFSRRSFIAGVTATRAAFSAGQAAQAAAAEGVELTGAKWIWLPSQRTLPSTFVLFRRAVDFEAAPRRAVVSIAADSRYRLFVNGRRVQWGPAPCDPRWLDVDEADITPYLTAGTNVIGVEVLFYGVGDGTWPAGKPGLLVRCECEAGDGKRSAIVSDGSWLTFLDRAHPPGHYKRWFLRALQEEFDARIHPEGWSRPDYRTDSRWLNAMVLGCPADKPPSSANGPYSGDTIDRTDPAKSNLRRREIPAVRETVHKAARLAESGRVTWLRDPDDWFESRVPGSFRLERKASARTLGEGEWELPDTSYATFEFATQMVGFPRIVLDAAAGTIIEAMPQESHDPAKTAWLDTHHFSWSRFICREGTNEFETFDYESLRWLQLSVRHASRPVRIKEVSIRRREYPWPFEPDVHTSEPELQKLFDAAVNTIHNSVIETAVDGMGRERQQYSGDGGHQLHAVRYAFGDTKAPRRYLGTFSEGLMKDGYFADSWPAYDRLARVSQKQMDGAYWGPLLDHGVGFNFDCWNHYMETGDADALREPYPRLKRFAAYLESVIGRDGLLGVVDLGIPTVWMDHIAYKQQRHKECSFNLYAAGMFQNALAPMAGLFGENALRDHARELSGKVLAAVTSKYWSAERGLFVDNLPWVREDGGIRLSDRTLAMAILYDQCPNANIRASAEALASKPPEMGISYPCNAGWRYWALAKAGRVQPIIDDYRQRWATMRSVIDNTAIQEDWYAAPDSGAQWSHCGVAPLYVTYMDLAGIRPVEPGFRRCRIRPQLGDLRDLKLTVHTVRGPIGFEAQAAAGGHRVRVNLPAGCDGELVLPDGSVRTVGGGESAVVMIQSAG